MATIRTQCPMCREKLIVTVPDEGYEAWCEGKHIQDAMPQVPKEKREQLMTGICPTCWDKAFKETELKMGESLEVDES